MKKVMFTAIACALLQGCAGAPYHHEMDVSQSQAMNIMEDTTRDVTRFIDDTPDGKDNFTKRTLGEVMSVGLAVWAFQNPISGIPREAGAIAAYSAGFDSGAPLHRQPILSAYWSHEEGDDEEDAGQRLMEIVNTALMEVAQDHDGEANLHGVQFDGNVTYGLWSLKADEIGCTADSLCAIRTVVNANSWDGLSIAEWAGRNSDNADDRMWRSVSYTDKTYSQLLVIKENGEEGENLEDIYKEISQKLPRSFAMYIPPVEEFGIHTNYPYVLQGGEKLMFQM